MLPGEIIDSFTRYSPPGMQRHPFEDLLTFCASSCSNSAAHPQLFPQLQLSASSTGLIIWFSAPLRSPARTSASRRAFQMVRAPSTIWLFAFLISSILSIIMVHLLLFVAFLICFHAFVFNSCITSLYD